MTENDNVNSKIMFEVKVFIIDGIQRNSDPCHFKDNVYDKIKITCGGKEVKYANNKDKGIIGFGTAKGQKYQLTFYKNAIATNY